MPRLAKVNLVGVLIAAIVIYFLGFIWYGLLFSEPYMNGVGIFFNEAGDSISLLTADGLQNRSMEEAEPLWMLGGFVIPLVLAFGLGWHMQQRQVRTLGAAAMFGLWLSLLIGVPLMAYDLIYTPWHSVPGFLTDASHTVVTFVAGCIVMSFFN
ncbi:DUF1761 domain-containing protein [Henriciella litoralis]|uniref:DUF1761 domain-containing protein n=1 Tax=Henriciella litoralis TaxID=568102 RepID=UPI0009FF5CEF|nr:DUF1761 domain-containing protein [Henriciella litoralis]